VHLNRVLIVGNLDLLHIGGNAGWVVLSNNHVVGLSVVGPRSNRAVDVSAILTLTPSPSVFRNTLSLCNFIDNTSIDWVSGFNTLKDTVLVVIGDVLLSSSSNGIVMLHNTNNVHHSLLRLNESVDLCTRRLLVNTGHSKQLV
jgi:hypothetical protein